MALADIQRALAMLYTDRATRERFWADHESVGAEWGLTPGDIAQLAALSHPEVDRYAGGLLAKRRGEVANLLSRTHAALGPRFRALFADYATCFTPSGPGKHRDDAVRFAAWLARPAAAIDRRIADVAAYEAACLTAFSLGIRWQVRVYRTAVERDPAEAVGGSRGRLTIALWFRAPGHPMRHLLLYWPRGDRRKPAMIADLERPATG